MTVTDLGTPTGVGRNHVVHIYRQDSHLFAEVARYVARAVDAGEVAIVIATRDHHRGFADALMGDGFDVDVVQRRGSG